MTKGVIFKPTLAYFAFTVALIMTLSGCSDSRPSVNVSIEEQRIESAYQAMPAMAGRLRPQVEAFGVELYSMSDAYALGDVVEQHGELLWQAAVAEIEQKQDYDDRPLYWSRLQMTRLLRSSPVYRLLPQVDQQQLMWWLELASRGNTNIRFQDTSDIKVLVTGFDPFFLDRNIAQSNPSGVVALSLDNGVFEVNGRSVEIQSYILPVRFADFDQGMVEAVMEPLLEPLLKDQQVDMVVTVSMGRDGFDLERFPGLRRSAEAPDNLNILTGANKTNPLVPELKGVPLAGPEFVEFSLPVAAMMSVAGEYPVKDNHDVTTLKGEQSPENLADLDGETSVAGSGGGYLSNEVSYRSIRLRNLHQPELPVGHIHTPRISDHDPEVIRDITAQVKDMVLAAAGSLSE